MQWCLTVQLYAPTERLYSAWSSECRYKKEAEGDRLPNALTEFCRVFGWLPEGRHQAWRTSNAMVSLAAVSVS